MNRSWINYLRQRRPTLYIPKSLVKGMFYHPSIHPSVAEWDGEGSCHLRRGYQRHDKRKREEEGTIGFGHLNRKMWGNSTVKKTNDFHVIMPILAESHFPNLMASLVTITFSALSKLKIEHPKCNGFLYSPTTFLICSSTGKTPLFC